MICWSSRWSSDIIAIFCQNIAIFRQNIAIICQNIAMIVIIVIPPRQLLFSIRYLFRLDGLKLLLLRIDIPQQFLFKWKWAEDLCSKILLSVILYLKFLAASRSAIQTLCIVMVKIRPCPQGQLEIPLGKMLFYAT